LYFWKNTKDVEGEIKRVKQGSLKRGEEKKEEEN
jgi:hypothetical protein